MAEIKDLIQEYDPVDVFNMDKIGLFYCMEPNWSLATHWLSGSKQQKEQLTIALTSNMDGGIKLPPFIINKSLHPITYSVRNVTRLENLEIS